MTCQNSSHTLETCDCRRPPTPEEVKGIVSEVMEEFSPDPVLVAKWAFGCGTILAVGAFGFVAGARLGAAAVRWLLQ